MRKLKKKLEKKDSGKSKKGNYLGKKREKKGLEKSRKLR